MAPETPDTTDASIVKALAWTLFWALALLLYAKMIGTVALIDPDEGRNAEVAREMAQTGDFIVPHLNGLPYLDKPILLFAASALSIRAFGVDELAARLPPLVFTLATIALVTAFGWRRFGPSTGLAAGMMLASTPLVLVFAGIVIFDAPMMFWVTSAAMAFHLALERESSGWCIGGWAAVGFAALTKGPVGLLLAMLIGLGEAISRRKPVRRLFCPWGLAVFVLLVGPWFLAVTLRHPEFPHYAFVRETFERVATDSMRRTGPIYYFLPIILIGAFPWITVLLAGGRSLLGFWRERAGSEVFLLLWVLLPTIFFSLSQSKRPGYILPVMPAVALLCARVLQTSPRTLRVAIWISAPIAASLGLLLIFAGDFASSFVREAPGVEDALQATAPYLGAGLIGTAVLALSGLRFHGIGLFGLTLMPLVLILGMQGPLAALGEQRSARDLALAIRDATHGRGQVVGLLAYPPSLSFYLEQPVLLATHSASEVRSNYISEYRSVLLEAPDSTLKPLEWWPEETERCPPQTVFILNTRDGWENERRKLAEKLPLIYRDHKYEVYGPCPGGEN